MILYRKVRGCPNPVWDGPYKMRCSLGGDGNVCARHGKFTPEYVPASQSEVRAAVSLTEEDVEAMARATYEEVEGTYAWSHAQRHPWASMSAAEKQEWIEPQRIALAAVGLHPEGGENG